MPGGTFRPKKNTPVGSKGLQLKRHIDATLGQGDLARAVALPPGEDLDEWLAVNVVDFYNAASVIYSTLAEFCTPAACPVMSAGSRYEYLWPQVQQRQGQQQQQQQQAAAVGGLHQQQQQQQQQQLQQSQQQQQQQQHQHQGCGGHSHAGAATATATEAEAAAAAAAGGAASAGPPPCPPEAAAAPVPPPPQPARQRPLRLCAPEYIERLFDWIEAQIDDERLFPQQFGEPFPPGFRAAAATVLRRLFRVYAHAYHSHFRQVVALGEEAHLNTCFKHFALFVRHFGLVDARELAPLSELIEQLCGGGGGGGGTAAGGGGGAAGAGVAAAGGGGGGAGGGGPGSGAVLPGLVGQNGGA